MLVEEGIVPFDFGQDITELIVLVPGEGQDRQAVFSEAGDKARMIDDEHSKRGKARRLNHMQIADP